LLGFSRVKVTGYLKTFINIMVTLQFHCDTKDGSTIEVVALDSNQIYIDISEEKNNILGAILLNRETAIKLSKELRKQIALLD
jgi:hypothetical protein